MFIGNTYKQASLISLIKEANLFTNHAFQTMKTITHCDEIIPNIIYCHKHLHLQLYVALSFLELSWKYVFPQRIIKTRNNVYKHGTLKKKTFEGHKKLVYIFTVFIHSFPVVDWFCLFIYLWVLTFPLEDCSEFGKFVITLINYIGFKDIFGWPISNCFPGTWCLKKWVGKNTASIINFIF